VLAKPGLRGGANWPPSSVDVETGYIYVCAADSASAFRAWDITEELPPAGEFYIGGNFGTNPMPIFGVFAALDLRTNKLVWQQHWPERCLSGSVATAGGLVFVGRSDGRFTALDSATGAKRWEFQTGAGVNAPASVFEHDGRQHVAVYSGGHSQGGAHGDSVWLFALGGTLDPVVPAAQRSAPLVTSNGEANLDAGRTAFVNSCVFCHGADGTGGHGGPAFTTARTAEEVQRIVAGGGNTMPAFGGFLDAAAIANVSAWVVELARRAEEQQSN
jgi:quinohemoprotein ethanol dehydrogenase